MIPRDLRGPDVNFSIEGSDGFVQYVMGLHPYLERDFILQAFWEHWKRMDQYFPLFFPHDNCVIKRRFAAKWLINNVRYDDNLDISREWEHHVLGKQPMGYFVLEYMLQENTWPFPPIIVSSDNAVLGLGCEIRIGQPYHLFEGTHRFSYLATLLSEGQVDPDSLHFAYELQPD